MSYYFTSESVSEGHPDKVSDAISDAILDYFMQHKNPALRCACETLVTTNQVIVAGEYKGEIDDLDIEYLVRKVVNRKLHACSCLLFTQNSRNSCCS